jgi:tetratricopeptide (TPR) repeat protein
MRICRLLVFLAAAAGACAAFGDEESAGRSDAADAPDPVLRDALAAEARGDSRSALELFRRASSERPRDAFILQKISRQLSDLSDEVSPPEEKKRLCTEALVDAERAVALAPDNAVNVLSVAICHGKLALLADVRGKISASRLMRDYAERALALDPNYALAHHVLGRWHYEVASLGTTKRFLVRLIYGGLPPASTAEAVRHLQRAVALAPDRASHRAELGFALLADGQRDAAREAFGQALVLPPREKYDAAAQVRARDALAHLR